MKTYKIRPWGTVREVRLKKSEYCSNGGLAIAIEYFDEEFGCWLPYGTMTVNLGRLNYGYAYVDTNNCPWAIGLIEEAGIGEFTGKMCVSGWWNYPLYKFDVEKMEEVAA